MTLKTMPNAFALVLATLAAPLAAQEADPEIDVNGDGFYSFPELVAVLPDMNDADFTTMDITGDGLIDMAELAAAVQAGQVDLDG